MYTTFNGQKPVGKLYEILMDPSLWQNDESSSKMQNHHQYESICFNCDPIYEEISEKPPPLPISPPPNTNCTPKPMFLGATKYDILSYLVDAKKRIIVPDESYSFKFSHRPCDELSSSGKVDGINKMKDITHNERKLDSPNIDKGVTSIERNDSGVGSETSKSSRIKFQPIVSVENKKISPIQLCEDCGKFPEALLEKQPQYNVKQNYNKQIWI